MEITVKRGPAQEQKTACLIVGVHAGKKLGAAARNKRVLRIVWD